MSSIVGHALAGMSVWGVARRTAPLSGIDHKAWFAAAAIANILPDIDSLVGLPHRGITHTLGFAFAVGALLAAATAFRYRRRAVLFGALFALIVWLHPAMDLLTGGGPYVELFWPISGWKIEAIHGGLPLHQFTYDWTDLPSLLFDPHTLRGMLPEALVFGLLFAASVVRRRRFQVGIAAAGAAAWIAFAVADVRSQPVILRFQGTVVDAEGKPVGGARFVTSNGVSTEEQMRHYGLLGDSLVPFRYGSYSFNYSGPEGMFDGKFMPHGTLLFACVVSDREWKNAALLVLTPEITRESITVRLKPVVEVRGRVNGPFPVYVQALAKGTDTVLCGTAPDPAASEFPEKGFGEFSFRLPEGSYLLSLWRQGQQPKAVFFDVTGASTLLDLGVVSAD